jgi:spermidine synthase
MAPVSDWLLQVTGAQPGAAWQWSVAFGGTFVLLLPATAAMGATLPAMERLLPVRQEASSIAALYAGNTFGAVLGVLATAFWLVPHWGLVRTALFCAALNGACAALALAVWPRSVYAAPTGVLAAPGSRGVLRLLAVTGLLGIGYEVLVVRVLSQVTENTVYTFALLLAVYLVGTAIGAASWQRWQRWQRVEAAEGQSRQWLLTALAAACLLGTAGLWQSASIKSALQQALGGGQAAALGAEAALAMVAFGLPTVVMGALFSHLAVQARGAGVGLGRALGVNTLGATAAAPLFGVLLLPAVGAKAALLLVVAAYLALSIRRMRWVPLAWGLAGATAVLAVMAPPLRFVPVPEGGSLVRYIEGPRAAVSVVQDADGVHRLHIDNRQQEGASNTRWADGRQALLPLLLHPAPRRALFLGVGTGITASTAALDRQLQVDAVELLPEVIEASTHFTDDFKQGFPNARLNLLAADARRFVRPEGPAYDLIVADNFHPARSGSGSLYTVEHFDAVRRRLAPGGLFCQWLPLHQMDLDTLRSVVQSFHRVYPGAWALLATNSLQTPVLGLVARAEGAPFDLAAVRRRLADVQLPVPLADYGLHDDLSLLGSFIAGPSALARLAADAPLNTDDRPVVAYGAPRGTYAPESLPRDRLIDLLQRVSLTPAELVDTRSEPSWPPRLAAYQAARQRFIEAGRDVRPTGDPQRMLQQVQRPLLDVLALSAGFRPAYDPLLNLALALRERDPAAARALLAELVRLQPARPEAAAALQVR